MGFDEGEGKTSLRERRGVEGEGGEGGSRGEGLEREVILETEEKGKGPEARGLPVVTQVKVEEAERAVETGRWKGGGGEKRRKEEEGREEEKRRRRGRRSEGVIKAI